jgi:hypothetical protein
MKKYLTTTVILAMALTSMSCSAGFAQSSSQAKIPEVSITKSQVSENTIETTVETTNVALTSESNLLTTDEIEGLLYMREEEKLAHDLYLSFYEKWGLPVFQNIASSEQTHTESIEMLLDKYGIPDPAADNPTGVFTNTALQDLYNQLIAQGSQSISDALKTGAAVEEIDILDLRLRSAQTSQPDILQVYQNLEMGSRNHLRSFISVLLNQTGESYSPGFLQPDDYQQIISSSMESYGQGLGGGNGRGGPRSN